MGAIAVRRLAGASHPAVACMVALVGLALVARAPVSVEPAESPAAVAQPLTFVANAGQTDATVRYMARGSNHAIYLTPGKLVLDFRRDDRGVALELHFQGANKAPEIVGERRTGAHVNYISGSSRHTNLAAFERIRYRDLWPGIDMVFRGERGALKYEFQVRPGADPRDIRLTYAGASGLTLGEGGSLLVDTPLGKLRDAPPKSVQDTRRVESRYALSGYSYGFTVGGYDRSRPLLIDPGLVWSTYLGGLDIDGSGDVVVKGNDTYVAGWTASASFPTTPGAYDAVVDGTYDATVTKLDADGALVYSTYLGGGGDDRGFDIAVDGGGHAYVTGLTTSANFPVSAGAYDTTFTGGTEFYVAKLNPAGSGLFYATYIGSEVLDVAVDSNGRALVAGTATSPITTTPGAPDTTIVSSEAFLIRLSATGTAADLATYIGGRGAETGWGVGVDATNDAYVVGTTTSVEQFPFTPGAYDTNNEGENAFIAKVDAGGTTFDYSTLLGTGNVINPNVAVDAAGFAYVEATGDVPVTPGAYADYNGCEFVVKLNQAGTGLIYATDAFLCNAADIDIDDSGNVYLVQTINSDAPTTPGAFDSDPGDYDPYIFKLNPTGTGQVYGTFVGGALFDSVHALAPVGTNGFVIVGQTESTDFPTTPGAHDQTYNNNTDAYVTRLQTFEGYPRPKGATPLRLSLVTAYKPCFGSGNRTHGPPLAHGSCNPPVQESDFLTVGTGDSNGLPARNEGHLLMRVVPGVPSTPADEADVELDFFLDDVFNQSPTPLTDYTGELRVVVDVRVGDRDVPDPVMSTIQDFSVPLIAQCIPTADTAEGSTCAANTTIGAIAGGGAINEGKRAIWQIRDLKVYDGGPDGDADTIGGQTLFARPGLFVP